MKGKVPVDVLHHNRRVIGDWLRRLREERGIGQAKFAIVTGLNQPTISKIERGEWNIGTDYISIYAHHLEFDLEKLFDEIELNNDAHKNEKNTIVFRYEGQKRN